MIQVKTSNWARRIAKRKPENSGWTWDVGKKALYLKGENIFYAFVDLKWSYETYQNISKPDVFIVPSNIVANSLGPDLSRYMFWIMDDEQDKYFENWTPIIEKLNE